MKCNKVRWGGYRWNPLTIQIGFPEMVCWPHCLDGCQLRNHTAWVWILAFPSHQMGAILTGWFWECKHLGGAKPCPTGSCSFPCSDGVGKIYYTILVWASQSFFEKRLLKSETDSAASQLFRMSRLVCTSASWAFHTCGGWSALRHGQTLRTVGQALSFRDSVVRWWQWPVWFCASSWSEFLSSFSPGFGGCIGVPKPTIWNFWSVVSTSSTWLVLSQCYQIASSKTS